MILRAFDESLAELQRFGLMPKEPTEMARAQVADKCNCDGDRSAVDRAADWKLCWRRKSPMRPIARITSRFG